jgi:hypothetical protein
MDGNSAQVLIWDGNQQPALPGGIELEVIRNAHKHENVHINSKAE